MSDYSVTQPRIVFGAMFVCPQCGEVTAELYRIGITINGIFQGRRLCAACLPPDAGPWAALTAAGTPTSPTQEDGAG